MKDSIKIDGINMSREYVESVLKSAQATVVKFEQALEELNTPEPIVHFTRLRHKTSGDLGVAITGEVQKLYATAASVNVGLTVVGANGYGHTYDSENHLRANWEVIQ